MADSKQNQFHVAENRGFAFLSRFGSVCKAIWLCLLCLLRRTCAVSARLVVTPKVGPEGLNSFLPFESEFLLVGSGTAGWVGIAKRGSRAQEGPRDRSGRGEAQ